MLTNFNVKSLNFIFYIMWWASGVSLFKAGAVALVLQQDSSWHSPTSEHTVAYENLNMRVFREIRCLSLSVIDRNTRSPWFKCLNCS